MKPTTASPGPFHEFVFHFINVISTRVLSSAREPSLLNLHFLARCERVVEPVVTSNVSIRRCGAKSGEHSVSPRSGAKRSRRYTPLTEEITETWEPSIPEKLLR